MIKVFEVLKGRVAARGANIVDVGDGNNSYAIKTSGRAFAWGAQSAGGLGNNQGGVASICKPACVCGVIKTFCAISGGDGFAVSIDKYGRLWSWGYNVQGQLGDNTIVSKLTPVSVLGVVKTFCEISAGASHCLAIDKNGRGWSWGEGLTGRLGTGGAGSRRTPGNISGAIKTFCEISAGDRHSLAIDKNGRAWAWGDGSSGRIGNNSTVTRVTPVSVCGVIKTFCKISAGFNHSAAIDQYGKVWSWGSNIYGSLGDNTGTFSRCTPVSIVGANKTFCQIRASEYFSVGLDNRGRIWTWGHNIYGNLGINSTTDCSTPKMISGYTKTFCQIAQGVGGHCLAVDYRGSTWAWGFNSHCQLGDNSTILSVLTPVRVFNY